MPMKNPPHPGDFIRTEIIEPAGLSVTAAAAALRVSRPTLSSLLNGKADLSGDMALRIERLWSEDGHAHADAVLLRYRPDPQAREANPRPPLSPLRGRLAMSPAAASILGRGSPHPTAHPWLARYAAPSAAGDSPPSCFPVSAS